MDSQKDLLSRMLPKQAPPDITPTPVRQLLAWGVPQALTYAHYYTPSAIPPPPVSTYASFNRTPGHGIRVVLDPGLNRRLLETLDLHLPRDVLAPPDLAATVRIALKVLGYDLEYPIYREFDVLTALGNEYQRFVDWIVRSEGLGARFGGGRWRAQTWASDWYLEGPDGMVSAITELTTSHMLGPMDTQPSDLADTARQFFPTDHPQSVGYLEALQREAARPGGMRIAVSSSPESEDDICAVEEDGTRIAGLKYWAHTIARLYQRLFDNEGVDTLLLRSYNVTLPFERDKHARNVLRVGLPVYRNTARSSAAVGEGGGDEITYTELAVAVAFPRRESPPLPVFPPLSGVLPNFGAGASASSKSAADDRSECDVAMDATPREEGASTSSESSAIEDSKGEMATDEGDGEEGAPVPPANSAIDSGDGDVAMDERNSEEGTTSSENSATYSSDGEVEMEDMSDARRAQRDLIIAGARRLRSMAKYHAALYPLGQCEWTRLYLIGDWPGYPARHRVSLMSLADSDIHGWVDPSVGLLAAPIDTLPEVPAHATVKSPFETPSMRSPLDEGAGKAVDLMLDIGKKQPIRKSLLSDIHSITPRGTTDTDAAPAPTPLVIKVMRPDPSFSRGFHPPPTATASWRAETALYTGVLRHLQGSLIPRCYGVLQGYTNASSWYASQIYLVVLEEVEGAVGKEEQPLARASEEIKQAILSLYETLHTLRVLHGQVARHNLRQRADGTMCVIELESARVVPQNEWGDKELEEERCEVWGMLGMEWH